MLNGTITHHEYIETLSLLPLRFMFLSYVFRFPRTFIWFDMFCRLFCCLFYSIQTSFSRDVDFFSGPHECFTTPEKQRYNTHKKTSYFLILSCDEQIIEMFGLQLKTVCIYDSSKPGNCEKNFCNQKKRKGEREGNVDCPYVLTKTIQHSSSHYLHIKCSLMTNWHSIVSFLSLLFCIFCVSGNCCG